MWCVNMRGQRQRADRVTSYAFAFVNCTGMPSNRKQRSMTFQTFTFRTFPWVLSRPGLIVIKLFKSEVYHM